jgi:hypothetical protein
VNAGAPHKGLAWLMRRIKSPISAVVFGLPGGRRDFPVQYKAKALRCQAMNVAGCTICRHRRQPDQNRDNRTHNTRSERLRRNRRGEFAWRTASWCRRARISVCSAARLRKLEAITAQRPTRTEFMMETTLISRMIVNYAFAARTEYSLRTGYFVACHYRLHSTWTYNPVSDNGATPRDSNTPNSHARLVV